LLVLCINCDRFCLVVNGFSGGKKKKKTIN
jgi:hypothetical protein